MPHQSRVHGAHRRPTTTRGATVDIGTNSVLLLVGEVGDTGTVVALHEQATITRLGEGVDSSGALLDRAIERTLAALRDYAQLMDRWGVERRAAVGTSALRDACNNSVFVGSAERILGCPIEVISGPREAALVQRGVGSALGPLAEGTVIVDVGGGSTEFIAAGAAPLRISLDIGTVRLTERHVRTDPPAASELQAIREQIRGQMGPLAPLVGRTRKLVGVAGTVTTLVAIEWEMEPYDGARVNGSQLDRGQIARLETRLASLPVADRRQLIGLDPGRADVIMAGAVWVGELMDHLGVGRLWGCDRGVRWGRLLELLQS